MPTKEATNKVEAEWMKKKANDLIEESIEAPPGRQAEINVELTAIKSWFSEKLDDILVFKATKLEEWRTELGSVAASKSRWYSTPEGRNEILLKGIIGRVKDQVSVIKQRIRTKELESFGSY